MSVLASHVDDYLRLRRAFGYKLEREGPWLADLAAFTDTANAVTLTNEITIRWACQRVGAGPNGWAKRLGVARKFAAYLQTVIPTTQIPPTGVFPAQRHRRTPHTCGHRAISPACWRALGPCRPRSVLQATRPCSGCSRRQGCVSVKLSD